MLKVLFYLVEIQLVTVFFYKVRMNVFKRWGKHTTKHTYVLYNV